MRRITVKHIQPGMITEQPVYDNWGHLLLNKDSQFTPQLVGEIKNKGVTEVFIRDPRVNDVIITPLISPLAEGALAKVFQWLVKDNSSKMTFSDGHLERVKATILEMVAETAKKTGDINVTTGIAPKDYMYLQPVKTAELSMAMGKALKLPPNELVILGMAAILKDACLPVDIINSVDCLAEEVSIQMRDHPGKGYKALSRHRSTIGAIALAVGQHHETWSGKGFPMAIKGTEISRDARIIAIADVYVDLLSERPGRGKFMPHEAIEYIMANGGDRFDPQLVEIFVRHIPSYPAGLTVQLNTGEIGIVSNPKLGFVARPIVRICSRPNEGELQKPVDMDLSKAEFQRMLITKVLEYD